MKIYLCGGINGLSDADAKNWREEAKTRLKDHECIDPMRRDYRGVEYQHVDEIVKEDLKDIIDSDFILVNATRPSWGTAMELVYAQLHGKIVIAIVDITELNISPWLMYHTDHIENDLGMACNLINNYISIWQQ